MSLTESITLAATDQPIIVDELVDGGYRPAQLLSTMRASRTNRKRFNQRKLDELTENIKKQGVLQPILIRPVTPSAEFPEPYEIVAGERRYLCSIAAGLLTGPVIIRKLSDLEAALIQTFENLHREDLHPMEEAEGFQNLMLTHGYSAEKLAKEMDVTKAYVYASLKLCDLSLPLRDAFFDDKFPASIAILLARIPVPAIQLRAMNDVLGQEPDTEAMPVRQAAAHIKTHYTLKLADAPFDIKDHKLTSAGSCEKCPKRTGNQPEIFADTAPNICTDPDCFADKRAAHKTKAADKLVAEAKAKGIKVFEGFEATEKNVDMIVNSTTCGLCDPESCFLHPFKRIAPGVGINAKIGDLLTPDSLPRPAFYLRLDNNQIKIIYNKSDIQVALELKGICLPESHQADTGHANHDDDKAETAPKTNIATPRTVTSSNGTVLTQKSNDAYIEKNKKEDELKERAAKETSYRLALYKKVRQRGFNGFNLASLRAFVKQMLTDDNGYELDEDVFTGLSGTYPFISNYTYNAACEFIDNAPLDVVQLILVDLVLSASLIVNSWNIDDIGGEDDRFLTVVAMAKAEGIDLDLARAELDAPATTTPDQAETPAPVAATTKPTKKKTATPKKVAAPETPTQASDAVISAAEKIKPWPYPTSKTAQPDPVAASAEAKPAKKTSAKQVKKPAAPQTNWPYPNIETQAK
ncbi:MAG: ParB/RepB/Spo0J family partition protein [Undibacterium umbellatum]|uniref:ParB/RepB/Spo0J family partition protein n=1 Tax=Undibacterium umbellatum TaxID=2762300 RepID=UPI003BB5DF12